MAPQRANGGVRRCRVWSGSAHPGKYLQTLPLPVLASRDVIFEHLETCMGPLQIKGVSGTKAEFWNHQA